MSPKPNEIYLVRIRYGESLDIRPCVIIEAVSNKEIKIVVLSSSIDLYKAEPFHFLIEKEENPDFQNTGLKRTSFVDVEHIIPISISDLGKRIGILQGELLKNFQKFLG
jgi:mRNA-degrading endonuclease toxin of MazEF toxin-antitoxin module